MTNSWIYQGRQYHGWFGHGKGPAKDPPDQTAAPSAIALAQRIHDMGHTLVAGLPRAMRRHDAARLGSEDHARLDRVLTAVVQALPLGLPAIADRVFGKPAGAPGLADIVRAATLLRDGQNNADLRAATDALGQAAADIGVDRFKGFLRKANEHLAGKGSLLTLVRDMPDGPPFEASSSVLDQTIRRRMMAVALSPLASLLLSVIADEIKRREFQQTIKDFDLDPSKREDVIAAYAYLWARSQGSRSQGNSQSDPGLPERVMRAARANPDLFARALAGNTEAQQAFTAAMQGPAPGSGIETHDEEERVLVAVLQSQGKSSVEIENALADLRAQRATPSTEQRRIMPGVALITAALPPLGTGWMDEALKHEDGSAIPGQVATQLNGRRFLTFNDLRAAIWRLIGQTPELTEGLDPISQRLMRNGNAPYPLRSGQFTLRLKGKLSNLSWQLHHDPAIEHGGPVYDLSRIRIVTPKQHDALTRKGNSR